MNFMADPDPTGDTATVDGPEQEVAGILAAAADQPDVVRRGWRYCLAGTDGRLYPVFGFSGRVPFPPAAWTRADCRPDQAPAHAIGLDLFSDTEHVIPGEGCGCGWRVYPSFAAATYGAGLWPDTPGISLSQADVVLAGVDYSGKLAGPPAGAARTDDEAGTLRARWLRIAGPIHISPRIGRPIRRALGKRYRAPVVKLDQAVFTTVADGLLVDDTAPDDDGAA